MEALTIRDHVIAIAVAFDLSYYGYRKLYRLRIDYGYPKMKAARK